jgi:hypothetical protein
MPDLPSDSHRTDGMDALLVCIRVPKSGSASLMRGLEDAFAGRRIFYLPDTLNLDGRLSRLQNLRYLRSRSQNLFRHYRTVSIARVYRRIAHEAKDGDLVSGGHIDFRTAQANIARNLRSIATLRDPVARVASEYRYLRRGYFRKSVFNRFDAGVLHRAAGRHDFDSFLDFLHDHRELYGDIASQYVGWDGNENLQAFFARTVFHFGVLEDSERFARELSEKLGRAFMLPHDNRTEGAREEPVSATQRARIEQIYARDLLLYEWTRARN